MEILAQKLVEQISLRTQLSFDQVTKLIDKCLMKLSAEKNISYNQLATLLYTYTGLTYCLSNVCSKLELEECGKSCNCVIYKNTCVPRYITFAPEINNDPDKWVKNMSTQNLQEFLEYASYLYYNYDGGGLTDNSFDALEYNLNKRLKQKARRWEKIGAEPLEKLKEKLPYPMASLDKIKPDTSSMIPFIEGSTNVGLVWSVKLDGISGMIIFKDGLVDKIYTRGNGEYGGNVTYLKDYIKLPKPSYKYFVVRGEFILKKRVWDDKYVGTYANPRALVSSKINTGYISPVLNDIEFIAYQIIDWSEKGYPKPSQAFKILESEGFQTPIHNKFEKTPTIFDIVLTYKKQRENSEYYIDGLVLSYDQSQPLKDLSNPMYSKAFKMLLEEQIRKTKVINVDWNITSHGKYFPVAVYESVYVDGNRLHRASAHNAQHIIDWHMGKGTVITVARSGDVIPYIKTVNINTAIEPILPDSKWQWEWKHKDIVLIDIEGNPEVQIKRIMKFFDTLETPQIGEGRIRKLYENGYTTIKSIVNANEKDFKSIKGFGSKISKILYDNIHDTLSNTRIDRFFETGIFSNKIGRKTLKQVSQVYPNIFIDTKSDIQKYFKTHKIPGIGPAKISSLVETIPSIREFLLDFDKKDIENAFNNHKKRIDNMQKYGANPLIKGNHFVFSGFMMNIPYELEDYLWDNMGEIDTTVTSITNALIINSVANISEKMMTASAMKIPVYTIPEFIQKYNVKLDKPLTEITNNLDD
jgi:DNA ligase (NAD+)